MNEVNVIVGNLYFKPKIDIESVLDSLQNTVNEITNNYPNDVYIIGGDTNGRLGEPDCWPEENFYGSNLENTMI